MPSASKSASAKPSPAVLSALMLPAMVAMPETSPSEELNRWAELRPVASRSPLAVEPRSSTIGVTSASAAAYGARYNLETIVIIPSGKIALGKLLQAMAYGAKIISIKGNFDQALNAVREISDSLNLEIVNSINPFRLEGQMTGAFEIVDELGSNPDFQFMPVGNAGNISSYYKGYKLYKSKNNKLEFPRLIGIQAENSAPLVDKKIVTYVRKFDKFYIAEAVHQDYYQINFLNYLRYKKGCRREAILNSIWGS